MTTITIDGKFHFEKTHFESLEDLQEYLMLIQTGEQPVALSSAYKKTLDERIDEAQNSQEEGFSWKEVRKEMRGRK